MLKSLRYLLKLALPEEPRYLWWLAVSVLANGLMPLTNIYFPKLILDELLGAQSVPLMTGYVAALAGLNLLFGLLKAWSRSHLGLGTARMFYRVNNQVSAKAMALSQPEGEKKSTLDLLERANYGAYAIFDLDQHLTNAGAALVSLVGSLILILSHDWRFVFLAVLPNLLALPCFGRIKALEEDNAKRNVPENRAFRYFLDVAGDYRWAKDLRLYKGAGLMLDRAGQVMDKILTINHAFMTKSGFFNGLIRVIIEGQTALIFIFLGLALAAGRITAGAFTLLYGACRQMGEAMNALLRAGTELLTADVNLRALQEVMALPEETGGEANESALPPEVQTALAQARAGQLDFVMTDLVFQYPTGGKPVLNGLNMRIKSGGTLALVGRNGAGKSSLVKLLCRLYAPDSGLITLNGVDIACIPLKLYKRLISPAFHDFKLLPFRLDESLSGRGLDETDPEDAQRLDAALHRVGLGDWLLEQPEALGSFLTKTLDEKGIVPSDGQEQKLALARSVYHEGGFLIMDEPTAALDPRSEEEVFRQMLAITRGQTALYISHRLSSTRFADRILVMDGGAILQEGDHPALMGQDGLYRRMFLAQATQYQEIT